MSGVTTDVVGDEPSADGRDDDHHDGGRGADDAHDDDRAATGVDDGVDPGTWRRLATIGGVAAISVGMLLFWRGFHLPGHNSGDDFALYTDQARALIQGDVGATLGRNRFGVDNSAWHTFSPYAYPWGLPLLLAPVLALTGAVDLRDGVDYGPLKMVVTATFLIAMLAYFSWLRRRIHWLGALLLPAFFSLNFVWVIHTDNVLSEFPFLMALMLTIVWLDRVRERGQLTQGSLWPLVVLGLLVSYAFSVRREGLGAMLGVGLGQLVAIWPAAGTGGRVTRWRTVARTTDWRRVATPWVSFAGSTILLQMMLPSELFPNYVERDQVSSTGLHRIPDNIEIYRPLLAEHLGLKDLGPVDTTLLGSAGLGTAAMVALAAAAILGLVTAAVRDPARELPVAGIFVGVSFLVLAAPYQSYRYIMALIPFFVYFAYVGIATPIAFALRRDMRRPTLVAELVIVAMIAGGWGDTMNARDYRAGWVGAQPGPQEPHALEMFDAVREFTRGDSVIVYHRARTMMLYTRRPAVQGGSLDFVESGGDYYVMYLEPDGSPGDYSQYPLTDEEAETRGFSEIWRNDRWVIWRTPFSRAPQRDDTVAP